MSPRPVLVIGAGPAGLAFACRYGPQAMLLERAAEVGGLSRSIEIGEGVFDIGGHSFHTPHRELADFVRELMGEVWHEQERDARVWFAGDLIAYPFQQFYTALSDAGVVNDCGGHIADAAHVAASSNFEEWILNRFGAGISRRHFMLPYNRKLWACDLRSMSCDWVSERVVTDTRKLGSQSGLDQKRQPLQSGSRVAYPAHGGFGTIFTRLADRCANLRLNEDIVRIDVRTQVAYARNGRSWPWRRIVSTMPLPTLLDRLSECPQDLINLAARLEAVSLKILMLLVQRPDAPTPQRVYVADPDVPPHKVAFNHTSSPSLQRRPQHAIMCEISYSPDKPPLADSETVRRTTEWLLDSGLLPSRGSVVTSRIVDVPFGYPVNTHDKAEIVSTIKTYLERKGIHTIGRFGAWDYANSDECMRQGLSLAARLADGI